jgi:hypothetical protein
MASPFSVVLAAFEVALAISFLLSLGFWGEHWSILCESDGTVAGLVRYLRGFSRSAPSRIRKSSRKLQIGAAVELLKAGEADVGDAGGVDLTAAVAELAFNTINDQGEGAGVDVPLVACPGEAAEQLLSIEGLATAVALDHLGDRWDGPLISGEAMTALGALAAAADGAVGYAAGLEGLGGGVAAGAVHSLESTGA